ncbi:MAG: nicotinate-nicotinamide nucleotide adenylyltransferase [Terriglobia bacterium]
MPPAEPRLRWVRRAPQGLSPQNPRPRLGVLGGTFNPVTRAHLEIAHSARREFSLAEVLFVLPEKLPHRSAAEASLEDRLALLEAALAPCPHFSLAVCSHGLLLEMARALAPHYPQRSKVYFLVGSDAAQRILLWDYPEPQETLAEMFGCFDLIVAERRRPFTLPRHPGVEAFRAQIHRLSLPRTTQEISATAVRERLRAGGSIDDLVPPGVAEAIRRRGLYAAP